jgi:hypothetical protein
MRKTMNSGGLAGFRRLFMRRCQRFGAARAFAQLVRLFCQKQGMQICY